MILTRNFMYNRFLLIIVVLAILIVGGAYLYKQSLKPNGSKQSLKSDQLTQTDSTNQTKRDSDGLPVAPATSSGKPVEDFVVTVKQDAKESADLSITDCKANPGVIKVKKGSTITIKNNDDKEITLQITVGAQPKVAAKKSLPFTVDTQKAIFTYGCDQTGGDSVVKAGVLYVE